MRLLQVVEIEVRIAKRVDELTHLEVTLLGNHHRKERIRGDIEWHAEKYIATQDEIKIRVPKGTKDVWKSAAGELSLQKFIIAAVENAIAARESKNAGE